MDIVIEQAMFPEYKLSLQPIEPANPKDLNVKDSKAHPFAAVY
jgi:hypothetical protein